MLDRLSHWHIAIRCVRVGGCLWVFDTGACYSHGVRTIDVPSGGQAQRGQRQTLNNESIPSQPKPTTTNHPHFSCNITLPPPGMSHHLCCRRGLCKFIIALARTHTNILPGHAKAPQQRIWSTSTCSIFRVDRRRAVDTLLCVCVRVCGARTYNISTGYVFSINKTAHMPASNWNVMYRQRPVHAQCSASACSHIGSVTHVSAKCSA